MRSIIATILLVIASLCLLKAAQAESGIASVYTVASSSSRTASGRPFRDHELTAAHRTLPFGTMVRVTNTRNSKSVVVMITDRGPFIRGRIIDLSMAGANAIGMGYGLAPVTVHVVSVPRGNCSMLPKGSDQWRNC